LILLVVVETLKGVAEDPYLYVPLLMAELVSAGFLIYLTVVYTNKVRKYILKIWR